MATPTLADILSWPSPNYEDPQTRVGLVLGVSISFTVLTVLVVLARIIAPSFTIKRTLGWDDWFMVLACALAVMVGVSTCISTRKGLGYHIWDLKPEWIKPIATGAWIQLLLFGPMVSITKISILLFYKRLFLLERTMIILIWAGIIFQTCFAVVNFLGILFNCIPFAANWDPTIAGTRCINKATFLLVLAIINTMSDIYVFTLPMWSFSKLQMPRKQKIGLMFVFGLGLVVCIASAIKIWYATKYFHDVDLSYSDSIISLLTAIETNVGIIGGSLPSIRPLIVKFFPNLLGSTPKRSNYMHEQNSFPFQNLFARDTYGTKITSETRDTNYINNGSEEHIVAQEGTLEITHTVGFSVESRARGNSSGKDSNDPSSSYSERKLSV